MSTPSPPSHNEKALILVSLELAEDAGLTRRQFLDSVSRAMDAAGTPEERRPVIAVYAEQRADNSSKLKPDIIAADALARARQRLGECGRQIRAQPWSAAVTDTWPAPIAHEWARLLDELAGAEGEPPNPEACLLQMRDAWEVLIKTVALLLLRGLIDGGGDDADWARRRVFRGLSLGSWVGLLRETTAKAAAATVLPPSLRHLAATAGPALLGRRRGFRDAAADGFTPIRNDFIGHGALAFDPEETARLIAGCVLTGRVRAETLAAPERLGDLVPLAEALKTMVDNQAFAGLTLEARNGAERLSLTGASATRHWLGDGRHAHHDDSLWPVVLVLPGGAELSLEPFVKARICVWCRRRDVMLYDSLHEAKRGGRFDLLDYARGHKSRLGGAEAGDLAAALADLADEDLPVMTGESLSEGRVVEALDRARLERAYRSPLYLRQPLADFLTSRSKGVFWLQAPAHAGKTTFVQGLVEPGLEKHPITPAFGPEGGRIVAYYCRKEYRVGVPGLLNALNRALLSAYDLSDNIAATDRPDVIAATRAATPAAFLDWLSAWRAVAARYFRAPPDAPLLVVIDGLDEAEPPGGDTPLKLLPRLEDMPDGLYLLLTSRPIGQDGAPVFLDEVVAPLYDPTAKEPGR